MSEEMLPPEEQVNLPPPGEDWYSPSTVVLTNEEEALFAVLFQRYQLEASIVKSGFGRISAPVVATFCEVTHIFPVSFTQSDTEFFEMEPSIFGLLPDP